MDSKFKLRIKGIALLGIVSLLSSCGGGGATPYAYQDQFGTPHP